MIAAISEVFTLKARPLVIHPPETEAAKRVWSALLDLSGLAQTTVDKDQSDCAAGAINQAMRELRQALGERMSVSEIIDFAGTGRTGNEATGRTSDSLYPELLAMAVRRLFMQYADKFPERTHLMPHDLRRRAITLTVKATGSIDAAASALGVRPETASRHYLDSAKAFDGQELMKRMAGILLPQNPPPSAPESQK